MALVAPGGAPPPPPPPPGGGGDGNGPPAFISPDYGDDLGWEDRRRRNTQMEQIRQRLARLRQEQGQATAMYRHFEQRRANGEIPYNMLYNQRVQMEQMRTVIRQREQEISQLDIRLINLGGGLDVWQPTERMRRATQPRGPPRGTTENPSQVNLYRQETRIPQSRQRYPLSAVYPPTKRQKRS